MAIIDSIKIELVSKLNPTVFQVMNADILGNPPLRLGANHSAVKKMVVEHEAMLKMLMPSILSTSPNDVNWYKKVNEYWNSFSLNVPVGGASIEIGFIYDITDLERKGYINTLIEKTKKDGVVTLKTDADLKVYVTANIPEMERYLYARPINIVEYLNWVYCLGHHKVANKLTDVSKSENIEFTLIDQRDIIEVKRATHLVSQNALKKYLEVIADRDKVKNILYAIGKDASKMEDMDMDIAVKHFSDTQPTKFIDLLEDKSLLVKSRIERYILSGVLRRLPNTGIIVDSSDAASIIGNTLDEAVSYFSSESKERVAKVNELSAKYKLINNKK